jgi:hypothetical protein
MRDEKLGLRPLGTGIRLGVEASAEAPVGETAIGLVAREPEPALMSAYGVLCVRERLYLMFSV